MNNIILIVIMIIGLLSNLFANDIYNGVIVFENHCISCHSMATKDDIKNKQITAPPIYQVHKKMKKLFPNKREFVTFVKDYIDLPSEEKAICKGAVRKFGLMPPIGLSMNDDEKNIVINYLYELTKEDVKQYQKKIDKRDDNPNLYNSIFDFNNWDYFNYFCTD